MVEEREREKRREGNVERERVRREVFLGLEIDLE